jgi:hypothetical protein
VGASRAQAEEGEGEGVDQRRVVCAPPAENAVNRGSWCGQQVVTQRLHSLRIVDVGTDRDRLEPVVRHSIGCPAVTALEGEPLSDDLRCERIPEPVGCLAQEQLWHWSFGQGVARGLLYIEDVDNSEGSDPHLSALLAVERLAFRSATIDSSRLGSDRRLRGAPEENGREDLDAPLSLVDLAPERLPRFKARYGRGFGALRGDQDLVVEGVGMEPGGDAEPVPPVGAVTDRRNLLGERRMESLQLRGSCRVAGRNV